MKRIIFMVFRCLFRVPVWFYHVWRWGRPDDTHTEQERYDYLRNIVKKVNLAGRVEVRGYGMEHLPSQNGFILFPNHQGLFDMLALIDTCPNPVGRERRGAGPAEKWRSESDPASSPPPPGPRLRRPTP